MRNTDTIGYSLMNLAYPKNSHQHYTTRSKAPETKTQEILTSTFFSFRALTTPSYFNLLTLLTHHHFSPIGSSVTLVFPRWGPASRWSCWTRWRRTGRFTPGHFGQSAVLFTRTEIHRLLHGRRIIGRAVVAIAGILRRRTGPSSHVLIARQLAVAVLIQLQQFCAGIGNLIGINDPVMINVQRQDNRWHRRMMMTVPETVAIGST